MADSDRLRRLLAWCLGTFHAAFFFTVLAWLLYRAGRLADLLGSLNTLLGTGLFVVFWALTWWTTRRALGGRDWLAAASLNEALSRAGRILAWAAANGLIVFLLAVIGFFSVLFAVALSSGTVLAQDVFEFLAFLICLVLPLGGLLAAIIGMVVGAIYAAIDIALLLLSRVVAG